MKKNMQNNFSDDGTQYSIKDPHKVALLCFMGAEIIDRDTSDSNNIIFTLSHDKMPQLVSAIHSGQPYKYLPETDADDFTKIKTYAQHHKEIMDFIRDVRMNRRGK